MVYGEQGSGLREQNSTKYETIDRQGVSDFVVLQGDNPVA